MLQAEHHWTLFTAATDGGANSSGRLIPTHGYRASTVWRSNTRAAAEMGEVISY